MVEACKLSRFNQAIRLANLNKITLDSNVGSGSVSSGLPTSAFDASGNIGTDFVDLDWAGPGLDAFPALLSKARGDLGIHQAYHNQMPNQRRLTP